MKERSLLYSPPRVGHSRQKRTARAKVLMQKQALCVPAGARGPEWLEQHEGKRVNRQGGTRGRGGQIIKGLTCWGQEVRCVL